MTPKLAPAYLHKLLGRAEVVGVDGEYVDIVFMDTGRPLQLHTRDLLASDGPFTPIHSRDPLSRVRTRRS